MVAHKAQSAESANEVVAFIRAIKGEQVEEGRRENRLLPRLYLFPCSSSDTKEMPDTDGEGSFAMTPLVSGANQLIGSKVAFS